MNLKVGVIGAGLWGTALAIVAARNGATVTLWTFAGDEHFVDAWPENLRLTDELSELSDADVWLLTTPTAFFRDVLSKARDNYHGQPVIICAKGLEKNTNLLMSEIVQEILPDCRSLGILAGPQFAAEVVAGVPTGSTLAGGEDIWRIGQMIFQPFHLSQTTDIVGAQFAGVGKNAIALICGYNSVAVAGENESALILTQVYEEVVNIATNSGARTETFLDFCGIGDLFLSATSTNSRNFASGARLARDESVEGTVEGVNALAGSLARAEQLKLDTPYLARMYQKINKV